MTTPAEVTTTPELTATLTSILTPTQNVQLSGGGGGESCNALIANLSQAISNCEDLNVNWVCYGSIQAEVSPVQYRFYRVGDRRPLNVLQSIKTQDENGIVLMNLMLEGEAEPVMIAVFGRVSIDTTEVSQTFLTIRKGNGEYLCGSTPPRMAVRTEPGETGVVTVNGVDIELK